MTKFIYSLTVLRGAEVVAHVLGTHIHDPERISITEADIMMCEAQLMKALGATFVVHLQQQEVPAPVTAPPPEKLDWVHKIETIRDPTEKEVPTWRVVYDGKFTTPRFNAKGPADAYRDAIARGERQPEF
jgi:hypothetical protein